jgi:hypothetical protein
MFTFKWVCIFVGLLLPEFRGASLSAKMGGAFLFLDNCRRQQESNGHVFAVNRKWHPTVIRR